MDFKQFVREYRFRHKWKYGQGIWRYMPPGIGHKAYVPWPRTNSSADPNELLRPWLEENAGIQGIHWSWEIAGVGDYLEVMFLNKYKAIEFKLMYG